MRTDLGPEAVADLLASDLVAVLATRRADDSILLSPVWFEWSDGGFAVWATSRSDGKVRHIARDPRVSIVVANSTWPYKGIEVRGTATLHDEGFYELLDRTARRYLGTERAERMVAEYAPGVVIRIEPGSVRVWDYAADG
jgi:PPOX class probable F420-dependent enzyme